LAPPNPTKGNNDSSGFCTTFVSLIPLSVLAKLSLRNLYVDPPTPSPYSEPIEGNNRKEGFACFYFQRQSIYKERLPQLYTPVAPIVWHYLTSIRRQQAYAAAAKNVIFP